MYIFFPLCPFFYFVFFWMDNFQWPVFDFSRSFSSTRSSLLLLPRAFFTLFPVVSKLQNFCLLLFCNFLQLSFSFCMCINSLILDCLSVLSCSTLSILKTTILNYLSGKSQISISLGLCFFDGVMFPCFPMLPESGIAVFAFEESPPPVFTHWLQKTNTFHQFCSGFWDFSVFSMDILASHFLFPFGGNS